MNDEMKRKIQDRINETCRAVIWDYEDWLYDGFVKDNEMLNFDTRYDLAEVYNEYALSNLSFVSNEVDNDFAEPILDPVFEWAKEEFGEVELGCASSWDFNWNDYHFLIEDMDEWDELIDKVRERVFAKWVESHPPLTEREVVKEFKGLGKDGFDGRIWIAKGSDGGFGDIKQIKDVSGLFDALLFGYGIRFLEIDEEDNEIFIWLCKMNETNITPKVVESMNKNVFKEAA